MAGKRKEKFSYSKLETYKGCPFKYFLKYEQKHFIASSLLPAEFGSLCHYIYETIGNCIKDGDPIPYDKLIDDFWDIDLHTKTEDGKKGEDVLGANLLAKKYPKEWNTRSKAGKTYADKAFDFAMDGIYRLEQYMEEHPDYEIVGCEVPFSFTFADKYEFTGFIDRLLRVKGTNHYIVHDIKTKDKKFDEKRDIPTPLQFVVYIDALQAKYGEIATFECAYDLPFADGGCYQPAGNKGFIQRGNKKIMELLSDIDDRVYEPSPSILCAWCEFSNNNPNQQPEGHNLCPYYNLSTQEKYEYKATKLPWLGMDKHFIQVKKLEQLEALETANEDDEVFEI